MKLHKHIPLILAILLLIPLYFINHRDSHDWGGDFAQYIHQAIHIAEREPQDETGYIFNENYAFVGPRSYPAGFPLMLAPVYMIFGNDIYAFTGFISVILILLGIVLFFYFKKFVNAWSSLFLVLILAYNPWILKFKTEVVSDLPFLLILFCGFLVYHHRWKKAFVRPLMLGLVTALLLLTRNIGWVFPLALLTDAFVQALKTRFTGYSLKSSLIQAVSFLAPLVLIYGTLHYLIFPEITEGVRHQSSLILWSGLSDVILNNLAYYIRVFQDFFHAPVGRWEFLALITKALALSFLLIGMIRRLSKGIALEDIFTAGILLAVLLYPNRTQAFRYLLPLAPHFLLYIAKGIRAIQPGFKTRETSVAVLLGLLVLLQYRPALSSTLREQHQTLQGPQSPESVEVFNRVRKNTPETALIAFKKPRVLALYTNRPSIANHPEQDMEVLREVFSKHQVQYLLTCKQLYNPALEEFVKGNAGVVELVFENADFKLYKIVIPARGL